MPEASPTKETPMMTIYDAELIAKAERLIAEGRLDEARVVVGQIERLTKARHKVTVEQSDDGDDQEDTWTEGATANGSDDADDDSSDNSDDNSDDDEEDDDDDGNGMRKALDAPAWSAGRPPSPCTPQTHARRVCGHRFRNRRSGTNSMHAWNTSNSATAATKPLR
jgi:hypothetical protein